CLPCCLPSRAPRAGWRNGRNWSLIRSRRSRVHGRSIPDTTCGSLCRRRNARRYWPRGKTVAPRVPGRLRSPAYPGFTSILSLTNAPPKLGGEFAVHSVTGPSCPGGAEEVFSAPQSGQRPQLKTNPVIVALKNWVVPPGLSSFFLLFPALKRWAKLVRPSGAGCFDASLRRVAQVARKPVLTPL